MANISQGNELNQYITDTLNGLITSTGRQIDKNERVIWDEFLHILDNNNWADMFEAFKKVLETENIFLNSIQERRYTEARTTFERDSQLRDRCMDILNKAKNTRVLAWGMIMVIREVYNEKNKINIPNVDRAVKTVKSTKGIEVEKTKEYTRITIFNDLFEQD